ncbi:MAG: beta-ketoacyl synthase chain length factor [Bacteroidetes bacterium]|nr:beta-ketoacyl synthase chain length factor [Bacteroidota bacterium]MCB9227661.1 beta-ketoacyl synthase chain length factor [Chitinophagales bacterium]
MKKCYVNGIGSVSAKNTFLRGFNFFEINNTDNVLYAIEPDYKDFISKVEIRRMEKGLKMSIAAVSKALEEAHLLLPQAIIVGTGMSCLRSSEKFLKAMLENNEQYLTPINFIQSTHNTVAGQLALKHQSKGYNFNYVNGSVSFESALLDAHNQIQFGIENDILIGGVDETNEHTLSLYKHIGFIKKEESAYNILNAKTKGMIMSEGAHFYVLQNEKSKATYAQVIDIELINNFTENEVANMAQQFLAKNNMELGNIDAVVLGNNGDIEFDGYYNPLESLFAKQTNLYYKHLSGEYNTASAFGFGLACSVLKNQSIPKFTTKENPTKKEINTVLLYNQYRGKDHSFVLLERA